MTEIRWIDDDGAPVPVSDVILEYREALVKALVAVALAEPGRYVARVTRDAYEVYYEDICVATGTEQGWPQALVWALWDDALTRRWMEEAVVAHLASGQAAYDAYAGSLERG